jgi:hypothetical protein
MFGLAKHLKNDITIVIISITIPNAIKDSTTKIIKSIKLPSILSSNRVILEVECMNVSIKIIKCIAIQKNIISNIILFKSLIIK